MSDAGTARGPGPPQGDRPTAGESPSRAGAVLNDLTVTNTSSSPYALKVMTVAAAVLFPVVLAYQGWTYYVVRRRVGGPDAAGGVGTGPAAGRAR